MLVSAKNTIPKAVGATRTAVPCHRPTKFGLYIFVCCSPHPLMIWSYAFEEVFLLRAAIDKLVTAVQQIDVVLDRGVVRVQLKRLLEFLSGGAQVAAQHIGVPLVI